MRTTKLKEVNINNDATFPMIAKELGENEGAIFECYKRALVKLQVALRRKGYKMEDFFGWVKNEH
jgi:hypothetical protein